MAKWKLVNKKAKKITEGNCYFCSETDYDLLDVHRITEGADGGKYTDHNTIVVCALCHRKITTGKIKTLRKYLRTDGKWVLNYIDEDGTEKFE